MGITLADQIFVERGHIGSHHEQAPKLANSFKARIFWLGHKPLEQGRRYKIKLATAEYLAELREILQVTDTDSLAHGAATEVQRNGVAEVLFRVRGLLPADAFADNPRLGRFVIQDGYDTLGGGIISADGLEDMRVPQQQVKSANITREDFRITPEQRALHNGHLGGVLWFTGLSGSGKSTIARELQQRLYDKGFQVYVLDGDNIRQGLCADLGFAEADRKENIRRIGEVAALFADAGFIVITAFISPYAEDRRRARARLPQSFNTVYIKADVETCEQRDVKGLYAKARKGEIKDFTGISAPYEAPAQPDITVDTAANDLEHCVQQLIDYIDRQFVAPVRDPRLLALRGSAKDFQGGGI